MRGISIVLTRGFGLESAFDDSQPGKTDSTTACCGPNGEPSDPYRRRSDAG